MLVCLCIYMNTYIDKNDRYAFDAFKQHYFAPTVHSLKDILGLLRYFLFCAAPGSNLLS